MRLDGPSGRFWFKANAPSTAYEAAILELLGSVLPDLGPRVVAVDRSRHWTLMHDAGPTLRERHDPHALWAVWPTVLQEYAAAQRRLVAHVDALLAAGAPDVRPTGLPEHLDALVEALSDRGEQDGGLSAEEVHRLREVREDVRRWCDVLEASGVPASLNNDDVHSANVCLDEGRHRFIDWGDAAVAHPFTTLLGTLNSIAWHAGCEVTDPRVGRLRDTYLEVWAGHGSLAERRDWVRLARRTGCVGKALSYVRAFSGAERSAQVEHDWPVRGWLLETLDPAVAG